MLAVAEVIPSEVERSKRTSATRGYSMDFLKGGGAGADLSAFLNGSNVLPGTYRVDIRVNGALTGRREVLFASHDDGSVIPCLTEEILREAGVDLDRLPVPLTDACVPVAELIEYATSEYDTHRLQLLLSIPQAHLLRGAAGYVSPDLWDHGIAAAFSNYNLNLRQQNNSDQLYLGMSNGINLGMWRLRNESSLASGSGRSASLDSNQTYAQRDITALKSQLTLGETYDTTETFDSVRFRGFALRSDDAMLPDSERGYAPIIRGVAESNATVEVRQNSYLLTQVNVPAGPFELSDISPSGSNGDLEITIVEADGRRRVTTQAFASLPRMVREGRFKYTAAAGQFSGQGDQSSISPALASGTLAYGWSSDATVYGGVQWAESFRATSLGLSRNTPVGAVSFDATQSNSQAHNRQYEGQSYRLLYSKTLAATDTAFNLASYRFSTNGYRTLGDHVRDLQSAAEVVGRARSRFDLTINQRLGTDNGSLHLTASQQNFWNRAGQSQQLQSGYSNTWGSLTYNLSLAHTRSPAGDTRSEDETRMTLTLGLPLGRNSQHRATSTLATQSSGGYNVQNGVSGQVSGWEQTHYNLQAGHSDTSGASTGASISTRTAFANLDASHTQGRDFTTTSLGMSGSLVAHAAGINLGQPVTETFALADVQGVSNAGISSAPGVRTGNNGFAVVPSLTPYRNNWVSIDTRDIGADVELIDSTLQLVPRRGSITTARFSAHSGRRVQLRILQADGTRMPFGAVVVDEEGTTLGITDPAGKALVLLVAEQGQLRVKHGDGECLISYSLPAERSNSFYLNETVQCADPVKPVASQAVIL